MDGQTAIGIGEAGLRSWEGSWTVFD